MAIREEVMEIVFGLIGDASEKERFYELLNRVAEADQDLGFELEMVVNGMRSEAIQAAFQLGFQTARRPDPAIFFEEGDLLELD